MTTHDDDAPDTRVHDADLRALFGARRPDSTRFAAGIAARLAQANDAEDGGGGTTPRASFGVRTLLDRAASVLPGFSSGSSLGKSWATLLSLPIVLLLGVIVTFTHGFHNVDPERHRGSPPPSTPGRLVTAAFPDLLLTLGSLLGIAMMAILALGGGGIAQDTVTAALLLSMMALTWHIGQAARAGTADPLQIARTMFLLQVAVLFGCQLWLGNQLFTSDSIFGRDAVGWILMFGMLTTFAIAWRIRGAPDPMLGMLVLLVLPLGAAVLERPVDSVARTRRHLQTLHLQPEQLSNWSSAPTLHRALQAAGAEPADLRTVRERLASALAAPPPPSTSDPVHPAVWTAAIGLGLLEENDLRTLARRDGGRGLDRLLRDQGRLTRGASWGYELDCILVSRELTAAQREHLAARAEASWPSPDTKTDELEQALFCARWLDRLTREDRIEAHRAELHELLRRHWVSPASAQRFSTPGGFCAYPENGQFADIRSTVHAVELMQFVGIPDGLPVHEVRAFLRHSFRTSPISGVIAGGAVLPKQAEAALVLLDHGVPLPVRTLPDRILQERAPLAALLLVALALRAAWLARRSARGLVGAMP